MGMSQKIKCNMNKHHVFLPTYGVNNCNMWTKKTKYFQNELEQHYKRTRTKQN